MIIIEFLLARIAEDEATAREASTYEGVTWFADSVGHDHGGSRPFGRHVERFDPERILAECEAKRRIVEIHTPKADSRGTYCPVCDAYEAAEGAWGGGNLGPCDTILALASVYADHRDFGALTG